MRLPLTISGWRAMAGAAALAGLALALSGCSGAPPDDADLEGGKQLYITSCSACHTLQDSGQPPAEIGPNLDDAFRGARQQGFEESQFAGVVRQWIEQPQPPMQANIVTGTDADDVAAYVASVAGTSPDSEIRPERPYVIRPPVPGGEPVGDPPAQLQEGEKIAGQGAEGDSEPEADEAESE
jgi:mono/diheme cytochrome c family protein